MKLLFSCVWDKEKSKTWSGTTYSLYKALSKKVDLIDCNIKINFFERVMILLSSLRIKNGKLIKLNISNKCRDRIVQKKIKRNYYDNNEETVLHVGTLEEEPNNAYCYLDLSIDSLIYYKEKHPELFQYSSYENISNEILEDKKNHQNKNFNNIKGIFTMSKWVADNLSTYTGIPKEKVHWVGGGINLDTNLIEEKNKEGNKILFVGRDFKRKGGDLVYNAFIKLKENKKDLELFIAGPKECPIGKITPGVHFLGDISVNKLSEYFNKCDIFCMPSRFEAYGLVFIEALVYGLPCIGRNEFAMREFIEDGYNGYLINNDDVGELSKKMELLLEDSEIKSNVISNREKYIKEYSWDTVAEKIVNIIKKDKDN